MTKYSWIGTSEKSRGINEQQRNEYGYKKWMSFFYIVFLL